MNMSLLPPCFSALKRVENKLEGNRVPVDERKLKCTLTKEPQNYISQYAPYTKCSLNSSQV